MAEVEMEKDDLGWSEVKRSHFFKVLIGDFKTSLRIPPKFVRNLSNDTEGKNNDSMPTKTATIEGPSGRIWHVKIEKTKDGGMFFTTGWGKFVQDHVLKENEFLVFRYNGNLHFSLLIFDRSACEKEECFLTEKVRETPVIHEKRENRERESGVLVNQREKTKQNKDCEIKANSVEKNKETNKMNRDCEIISNCEEERERKEREEEVKEVNFEEIKKFIRDCETLATKKRARNFEFVSFDKRKKFAKTEMFFNLTKKIKNECVDEFGNSSPDSNITNNKEVHVGNNNASPPEQKTFIIDEEVEEMDATNEERGNQERESEVLVTQQERESEEGEGEDQAKEVKELNYEEIMKLARDCENLATKKRAKDFEFKSFSFEERKKSAKADTLFKLKKEIKKEYVDEFGNSSPDSNIMTNKKGNNNISPHKQKSLKIDDEVEEISINEMPLHARCNSRNYFGRVKIKENLKALEAAMSFQSKFPSSVIHMTKYNAKRSNCVRFPTEFSRNYLPRNRADFILRDVFDKEWVVNYRPLSGERGTITRGWPLFKRENLLKEDDCCVFELVKLTEFRVHIFRAG